MFAISLNPSAIERKKNVPTKKKLENIITTTTFTITYMLIPIMTCINNISNRPNSDIVLILHNIIKIICINFYF